MRQGEDDKSALSYLTVTVDDLTNTPRIAGKAFGLSGESPTGGRSPPASDAAKSLISSRLTGLRG
jgi:hypothetical protein